MSLTFFPLIKYKNAGDVAGYHKVLDDILTNWKQDYYKYTAR